jgi:hypothetical protein
VILDARGFATVTLTQPGTVSFLAAKRVSPAAIWIVPVFMQLEFPERQFQELRFHLRELRLDLGASIKECKSLMSVSPELINASETTQLIMRVRYDFENLIVRIEHIITSHLSQSLRIVGKVLSN